MSEEGAGAGQGEAPPGDGSQQEQGGKKAGRTIPIEAFNARINDLRGELTRERQAREAAERLVAETQRKAAEPRPLTRAQLNAAVEAGQITQQAADTAWDRQVLETAGTIAEERAGRVVEQREKEAVVNAELAQFQTLVPAAWEEGSRERQRVAKEYKALVALGLPATKATELAALRAAFGDPEAIRTSRSTGRSGPGDTFQETGGAGGGEGEGGGETDGAPKGLKAESKARYERLIQQGVYADWTAVKAELKYAKPRRA